VAAWEQVLSDHRIVNPHSAYVANNNVGSVDAAVANASLVADLNLTALRRVLTYLVRAERHTGGGW